MAFVKILIHVVWGTKNRVPLLTKTLRPIIIDHIKQNARKKGIFIDRINGYTDHLHCLIGLPADLSISKAVQLIKGESAFWVNHQKLIKSKFEWADEYFAVSVSESVINHLRVYIDRQEEHHKSSSFQEEFDDFMKAYYFHGQG